MRGTFLVCMIAVLIVTLNGLGAPLWTLLLLLLIQIGVFLDDLRREP